MKYENMKMAEAGIHRHPTVPMTRKDTSVKQEQLPSSSYNTNKRDLPSQNKSRETNLKRADSYRRATNTLSIYDDLSNNKDSFSAHGNDQKTKYNTLPVNSKLHLQDCQNKTQTMNRLTSGQSANAVHRNVSQKSGSFPSPDTDEDQMSVPDIQLRKRKRWFGRNKQPQISTKKESDDDNKQKDKKRSIFSFRRQKVSDKDKTEYKNGSSVLKISRLERKSYTEQHSTGKNGMSRTTEKSEKVDIESKYGGLHSTHRETYSKEVTEESDTSSTKQGPFYLFSKLKKSFRKKKKGSRKQSVVNENTVPKETGLTDSAPGPQQPPQSDVITEIFEALIDPLSSINHASGTFSPKKADRSKLHLDGLRKARPAGPEKGSFCKSSSCSVTETEFIGSHNRVLHEVNIETHEHEHKVLTPTVELDGPGFDFADGPEQELGEIKAEAEFSEADDTEQNRRVTDVAHRLQLIGDQIVSRRESSHSSSEGGSDHASLIDYLRQIGDNVDSRFFQRGISDLTPVIVPVVRNLIMAETYDRFQSVIRRELQDTVGWEQVAWYTYVTRSAILVVSQAMQVGSHLRQMTSRYFSEHIRPFIEQQPNGWV
ncbi:hypothetical protein ACJMK2_027760 [Sinanodonta woodiana]|uniref:Uncharacterized protein n=1 Tax=Sinanodonta woodiana TaxID=1069815 RepID=A0ABD3X5I0_SINWO